MPQTLLALLALSIAAFFTLGQKRASNDTLEHVVKDEFELVVSGALLHAMEFADSRSFDEATTPEALRVRLGLPGGVAGAAAADTIDGEDLTSIRRSDLAAVSRFGLDASGSPADCNAFAPAASPRCNDISDLASSEWQLVTFNTPNGSPLPVQIRYDIQYVNAGSPDVVSATPTFHKRVDVFARSPILMRRDANHVVHLRRVISYDPVVAAEYLRRRLRGTGGTGLSQEAIAALQAAAATARATAEQLRASAEAAAAEAAERARAVSRAARTVTEAEGTLSSAQTTLQNLQSEAENQVDTRELEREVERRERALEEAEREYDRCERRCGDARWVVRNAELSLELARVALSEAGGSSNPALQAQIAAAQLAVSQAEGALVTARSAAAAAEEAARAATVAATAAEAAAVAAETAARQAEDAVLAAGGQLP